MKRLLIVNVVLLVIAVGLIAQIAMLWWRAEPAIEPAAPKQAKQAPVAARAPVRRPPPADVADKIAAKDLFDPTRAPAPVEGTVTTEEPVKPLTLALMGVMVAAGERQVLVKDQAQPKPIWLREGEQIGGYSVARIEPTAVVMASPTGDEIRLMINVEKGKPGAAPPTGPAGVQPQPTAVMAPPRPPGPAGAAGAPSPAATPARPRRGAAGADIKEKIERLREEARRRRGQPPEQPPPQP